MSERSRRTFLAVAALAGAGAAATAGCSREPGKSDDPFVHGAHGATESTAGLTPDEALVKLTDGNARFVAMTEVEPNVSATRLMAVSKGQNPFVGVLGCVDSRVPPELIFDRGLGDVFDARIAGAIADDAAIGSLEFGVEEFDVPLLVVLGHSRCGAVTATVKALDTGATALPGKIGAVAGPIVPAVREARARGVAPADLVNVAAREVVRDSMRALSSSSILSQRISDNRLKIVGAFYDLDSGKVEFLTP